MTLTAPTRQPAGQPTGGQFATQNRPDGDVALNIDVIPVPEPITINWDEYDDLPEYPAGLPEPVVTLDWNNGPETFIIVGGYSTTIWSSKTPNGDDETHSSFEHTSHPVDWTVEQGEQFEEWAAAVHDRIDSVIYGATVRMFSDHNFVSALIAGATR